MVTDKIYLSTEIKKKLCMFLYFYACGGEFLKYFSIEK